MNFVQPIRDPALIRSIEKYLLATNERNYILFLFGIYTGLRISDILSLRVADVKGKKFLVIKESKTKRKKNNTRTIELNPTLRKALRSFLKDREGHEYLIKSRVGKNKAITRERAYDILREVADIFEIESLGCHSMRKTLGFHIYHQTKDIVTVQKVLNHENPKHTLRYIGIEQDQVNTTLAKMKYY